MWGSHSSATNMATFIAMSELTQDTPKRKGKYNPVQEYLKECRKNRTINNALK